MDSSMFLANLAAAIGFFTLLSILLSNVYKRFRFHPQNNDLDSSSLSSSSPPSSSSLTTTSSSSSCKWTHDVFPSFRGEDVRRNFLSHIQKEFCRKGIIPFIDNEIKRGESIGPELKQAIKRSKIAIVLLSRNYASSKWCLEELAEIMNCKKEGQTVFAIFYEVDPSHVKKLTGEFGAVFKKTCAGKTKEDIRRWKEAFAEVATIAGYDSRNWDNEAVMIEEIVTEISKRLISSKPSRYMDGLIGMEAHIEKLKPLICLGSDEVRTIGIWGPCGIGKTTIARVLHDQISSVFQLSAFMTFKPSYARPTCSDDHDEKLHLEQQFLSQLINQGDVKIPHLGAAHDFVMGKKVLVIFDGVEQIVQLLAMPQARYFGPGSRIIITTQNLRLLDAFKIEHIYQVNFPPREEALQIFCMSAFGQNSPHHGYEELAWEVTNLAGRLPLGLRIMGSHLQGMSKEEWEEELPRLRIRLNGEIGSILKFSYDSLDDEDKNLFLHIACFFIDDGLYDGAFEDALRHKFSNVRRGLKVLVQKSLIDSKPFYKMHNLLVQLGREIVRNQSIHKPGKRQFLVDAKEICEVLSENRGSKSITGINCDINEIEVDLCLSERAFEKMSNLQLLRFSYGITGRPKLELLQGVKYLPPKLRILSWNCYSMKSLPSNFNTEFLVKIQMENSKLEKLWEGIQPLRNLRVMNFKRSKNLKELPDLSTATNLREMELSYCSSIVELPSSIENLTNLQDLILRGCSSLLKIPSSIWNLTNIQILDLSECPNLVQLPSSIEHLTNLRKGKQGCSKLQKFPSFFGNLTDLLCLRLGRWSNLVEPSSSIWGLTSLQILDISGCLNIVELPFSIGNLTNLVSLNLSDCSNLVEVPSFIGNLTNLERLDLSNCLNLVELPSSIGNLQMLKCLDLHRCSKLEVLPINIDLGSLEELNVSGCSQLRSFPEISRNIERLDLCGTLIKEIPLSIKSWSKLYDFSITYFKDLEEFPHVLDIITKMEFNNTEMEELPSWINGSSRLVGLVLKKCRKLVSLPQLPNSMSMSMSFLVAENCDSLERLACPFPNPNLHLRFVNCWKLNEEARDIIIRAPSSEIILPGIEVPAYFTHRATYGGSLTVKLDKRSFPTLLRFKVCFLLANKSDKGARDDISVSYTYSIVNKQSGRDSVQRSFAHVLQPLLTEHLYIFEVGSAENVKSDELFFEFKLSNDKWEIAACGIRELYGYEDYHVDNV